MSWNTQASMFATISGCPIMASVCTAATVLGAVGGGYAGNEIEKRTHTVTVYQVGVRMDNGTLRSVETRSAPPIGKAVRLKGHTLSPADGHK